MTYGDAAAAETCSPGTSSSGATRSLKDHGRPLLSRDWMLVVLLLLLNLLFFADPLFTGNTFFIRDVGFFHYPLKKLVTESYQQGQWPLWNPYVQLGQPLLANPNAMAFYPTQLLFQLLPFEVAFELHFVLHCFLAGAATFYLARKLEFSRQAAFLSASAYNFCGATLSFLNVFNILPVVAFLPLLALALLSCLEKFSPLRLAAASGVMGAFCLLLEPLSTLATAMFLLPFLLAAYRTAPTKVSPLRAVALLSLVGVSGILLACVQILPTLELLKHSGRQGGLDFSSVSYWSMTPSNLWQAILPRPFGDWFRLTTSHYWGAPFFEGREPYLFSCYWGLLLLSVAWCGLILAQKRWLALLLAIVGSLSVLLAMGRHAALFQGLFSSIPLFRYGRYPVKYLFVASFCIALLAGLGLDGLRTLRLTWSRRGVWEKTAVWLLPVCFIAIFGAAMLLGSRVDKWLQGKSAEDVVRLPYSGLQLDVKVDAIWEAVRHVRIHSLVALLCVALLLTRVRMSLLRPTLSCLILLDLVSSNLWINPVTGGNLYDTAPAASYLREVQKREGLFRIYALQQEDVTKHPHILGKSDSVAWAAFFRKLTLFPLLAAKDGLQYASFIPIDKLETLPSQMIYGELEGSKTLDERVKFLAGLNVAYVAAYQEMNSAGLSLEATFDLNSREVLRLYRVRNRLARAVWVEPQTASFEDFRFQKALSVEDRSAAQPLVTTADDPSIQITRYTPNWVTLDTSLNRHGVLVLVDSYYPGWKADVDGRPTEVKSANYVYRAVEVSAGKHRISFRYDPDSFRQGLWISSVTAAAWMLFLAIRTVIWCRRELTPAEDTT